jgi:hypothetical protein
VAGPDLPTLQSQGSVEGEGAQPGGCRAAGAAEEAGASVPPLLGAGIVGREQGVEAGLGLVAAVDDLRLGDACEPLEVVGACRAELGLPQNVYITADRSIYRIIYGLPAVLTRHAAHDKHASCQEKNMKEWPESHRANYPISADKCGNLSEQLLGFDIVGHVEGVKLPHGAPSSAKRMERI